MRKFMSVFLAATFLAAAPVFAFEGTVMGDDEYATPMIDSSYIDEIQAEDEVAFPHRRYCPRGWRRVPEYRWNYRRHRWEIVGWRCRRHHGGRHPGYPGYPGDRGEGRGSPPPGYPGYGDDDGGPGHGRP